MKKTIKVLYAAEIASLAVCAASSAWLHDWVTVVVCGVAVMNCVNAIMAEQRASSAEELSDLREGLLNKYRELCVKLGIFPKDYVSVIVAENSNKTYLEDYRKKYPGHPVMSDGLPTICPTSVYGKTADMDECPESCEICWNRKMKEGEET